MGGANERLQQVPDLPGQAEHGSRCEKKEGDGTRVLQRLSGTGIQVPRVPAVLGGGQPAGRQYEGDDGPPRPRPGPHPSDLLRHVNLVSFEKIHCLTLSAGLGPGRP
jgi:hypothetical protein